MPHAEVGSQEHVGIAEAAHRDVRRRPRPDPRRSSKCGRRRVALGAGVDARPRRSRRSRDGSRARLDRGARASPQRVQRRVGDVGGFGNRWVRPPSGTASGVAVRGDEAAREGACRGERHLLAEHGPHRELEAVDRARARAGRGALATSGPRRRSAPSCSCDGLRVGVEVEQPAAALHRGGEIAKVVEPQRGSGRDRPRASARRRRRRAAGAACGGRSSPSTSSMPGTARAPRKSSDGVAVERRAARQPQTRSHRRRPSRSRPRRAARSSRRRRARRPRGSCR